MRYVWINPNTHKQYITAIANDPNVPAGFLLTNTSDGSAQFADGIHDQDLQVYMAGVNSGGFPTYTGDPTADPKNPNGVLGG